jgi:hypothetical protein
MVNTEAPSKRIRTIDQQSNDVPTVTTEKRVPQRIVFEPPQVISLRVDTVPKPRESNQSCPDASCPLESCKVPVENPTDTVDLEFKLTTPMSLITSDQVEMKWSETGACCYVDSVPPYCKGDGGGGDDGDDGEKK